MRDIRHRRWVLLLAVVSCVPLTVPAVARADRAPTRAERRGIARAARAVASRTEFVRTSRVRISTVGHWAKAAVALYRRSAPSQPEMTSEEVFLHTHGHWVDGAKTHRQPPDRVLEDLGLDTGGGPSTTLVVILIVVALVVVCSLLGAITSPSGPPSPRFEPSPREPPARAPYQVRVEPPTVMEPCPRCHGTRKEPPGSCGLCYGTGWKPNPYSTPGGPTTLPCDCKNKTCTGPCGGTGQVAVANPRY